MKTTNIQIVFDENKMEALRHFLSKEGSSLDAEVSEMVKTIYRKHVPAQVRAYLDRDNDSETKTK